MPALGHTRAHGADRPHEPDSARKRCCRIRPWHPARLLVRSCGSAPITELSSASINAWLTRCPTCALRHAVRQSRLLITTGRGRHLTDQEAALGVVEVLCDKRNPGRLWAVQQLQAALASKSKSLPARQRAASRRVMPGPR
jgi:hypothetical protein